MRRVLVGHSLGAAGAAAEAIANPKVRAAGAGACGTCGARLQGACMSPATGW